MASSYVEVTDIGRSCGANASQNLQHSNLNERLIDSVFSENVNLLIQVLNEGADINILLDSGISLLGKAVRLGNEEIITTLLNASHYLPVETVAEQPHSPITDAHCFSPCCDCNRLPSQEKPVNEESSSWNVDVTGFFSNPSSSNDFSSQWGLGLFRMLQSHAPRKHGCNVNFADYFDRMPIHYAAETGNLNIVKMLIKAGCLLHVSDNYDVTPLHLAVRGQHVKMVEFLLSAGSRVNSKTRNKWSALHLACSLGNFQIVKLLLDHGAFTEALDTSEETPLIVAVRRGHFDVVKLLLREGAKASIEEIHGCTPLSEAVCNGDMAIAQILISFGAKIRGHYHLLHFTIMSRSYPLCKLLVESGGAYLDYHDDNGDTPLHVAVKCAEVGIVKLLLERGCNVLLRSQMSGKTCVHAAVEHLEESAYVTFSEILKLLVLFGADLDSESYTPGETPLFQSILYEKFLFSEELIRHGCDPNLGNVFSCKTNNLDLGIKKKNLRIVKLLIYSGFSIKNSEEASRCSVDHSKDIHRYLRKVKECPLPLSILCRFVIRERLKNNIVSKVDMLHFPILLKDFLKFQDKEFLS